jgi:protocatechuate 3,4-dioxygenase, alpha subunit
MTRLITRIYFEGEAANADDPILRLVPEGRRETLIAKRLDADRYHFPIVLQGERETVFFDV